MFYNIFVNTVELCRSVDMSDIRYRLRLIRYVSNSSYNKFLQTSRSSCTSKDLLKSVMFVSIQFGLVGKY